jgi:hypothetical protein
MQVATRALSSQPKTHRHARVSPCALLPFAGLLTHPLPLGSSRSLYTCSKVPQLQVLQPQQPQLLPHLIRTFTVRPAGCCCRGCSSRCCCCS